ELLLLVARVVRVVLLDRRAERLLHEVASVPELLRLAEGRGEGLRLAGLVGVALQLRTRIRLVLDPIEASREQGGHGEIRVRVRTRDAAFGAAGLPVPHDSESAGAVVPAP